MTIFSTGFLTGKALLDRLGDTDFPALPESSRVLSGQDTTVAPDATATALPSPEQIAGQAAQIPIEPQQEVQPIPAGLSDIDIATILGAARPKQEFEQPQIPDLVSNVLAGRQQVQPDTVQTLNGVQEPGIAEESREIPDTVAAEAPDALASFGDAIFKISGELATNPILQDELASIAQALTARSPQSFPFQLATSIRESAQGQQAEIARQAVIDRLAGREPDDRVDPNMLTLSPELRSQAQLNALNELNTAANIQKTLGGIQTPQEREVAFELTQAQIDASESLTTQRNLETVQLLTSTGIGKSFDSTQLSLLRLINDTANKLAAQAGGIQGVTQDASGNTTFRFKNPDKYTKVFIETRDQIINSMVASGTLPEEATLLTAPSEDGTNVAQPQVQTLDKTTQPPDSVSSDNRLPKGAKFIGSEKKDGVTLWYYDTTGDGRINTAIRTK